MRVLTVSLRGTSVIDMSLFQFEFERRKCPSVSAETSARRERPAGEEEEEGSREDDEKAAAAKRRNVSKSWIDDIKCLIICVTITSAIFILHQY